MFWNLFNTTLLIAAGLMAYRFGPRVIAAIKRFDEGNRKRIEQERSDRGDRLAHFRHTMDIASEQVEEIAEIATSDMRTGLPVTLFLFEGETFASRDEAEQARARKVYVTAHAFYAELPIALSEHKPRGNLGRE